MEQIANLDNLLRTNNAPINYNSRMEDLFAMLKRLVELDKRNPFTDKPSKGKNGI